MEEGDTVLSDALVGTEVAEIGERIGQNGYGIVRTRYEFWNVLEEEDGSTDEDTVDSEGDLKLRRRPKCRDFLVIDHTMETRLDDVGLQIWNGALLLCDYVLFRRDEIAEKVILELGCGAGMTAICAGLAGADVVFATDSDPKTLILTDRNVNLNSSLLQNRTGNIRPRVLDWRHPIANSMADWSSIDQETFLQASVILAADVIYDPDLNELLFAVVEKLCEMGKHEKTILISLEKRYNFTLAQMDVACPAYTHFVSWTESIKMKGWSVERIDTNVIPLCFNYRRSSDMELWKLCCL